MPLHAVVAGATGLVGRALVDELLRDDAFERVTLVGRRALPRDDARLDQRVVDMASLTPDDLPPRVDAAFCALGTTIRKAGSKDAFRAVDHEMALAFARAAHARGARSLHVVSAIGADAASRVFYNRVKGEMERDVRAVGVPATYAYRPSLLVGTREEQRRAERAGLLVAHVLRPLVAAKWRAIPAHTVARAMARDARAPEPGFHVVPNDEIARRGGAP